MYYDTYRGKKRRERRRRQSCFGWLMGKLCKLLCFVLVLLVLAAGALYAIPPGFMNIEPSGTDLALTDGLPDSRVNILLLGLDFLKEDQQRSDAMIIASIGYDGVKLTSVMRDTMVDIPGYGRHKLNSAYSYGGPDLVMRVINETFQLNITNYIALDLCTLIDVIDAVGGVTISIEENELYYLNRYAWVTYRQASKIEPTKYLHYQDSQPVTEPGKLHLNGLFATGYTRIRYTDSDYMRTARQREVFQAIFTSMRSRLLRPDMYLALLDVARNSIRTNMNLVELISLGEKILISGSIDTNRVPRNEHLSDNGSSIEITKPAESISTLHAYIYG